MSKAAVCHVTCVHGRYDPRIFSKQCVSLVRAGYDVSLVVTDDYGDEVLQGVKIRTTGYKIKNRIRRLFSLKRDTIRLLREIDADIYHFHDPELMPVALIVKKRMKKTVIFDFHENTEKQILDKTWIPRPLRRSVAKIYSAYERVATKRYDALIGVTPAIVQKLQKRNRKVVMITNYPITGRRVMQRKDVSTICFAGGISEQWNHDKIIEAIDQLDGVTYMLLGSGSSDYFNRLKNLPGWKNVDYRGKVPHKEVKGYYSNVSVGMALNYSSQLEGEGSLGNTKLFEYMEAGLPVICTDYRLWRNIVEEHQCGICVDPHDVGQIARAIEYLTKHPTRATQMGLNGRKAVEEHYNWGTQEKILHDLYRSLLQTDSHSMTRERQANT